MAQSISQQIRSLCIITSLLLSTGTASLGQDEMLDDLLDPQESKWDNTFNVRTWSGYKDNVLLGNKTTLDSAFVGGGMDALLWRLPENGWDYFFYGTADYTRYLPGHDEVDHEFTAIAQAQAKKKWNEHWTTTMAADFLYIDQVFDNSTFDRELRSVPIQGHTITARPALTWTINDHYWSELDYAVSRQEFHELIDDYWETGPRWLIGRRYGNKSDLTLSYEFNWRVHDTREPRSQTGLLLPGKALVFHQNELILAWRHYWDEERHWRTVTKVGVERLTDNGPGYYDYWKPLFSHQLRYQTEKWHARTEARLNFYDYDNQAISEADPSTRHRTLLTLSVRGERQLTKALKLFAEYMHEHAISNLDLDRYKSNTVLGGIDWEF